ncbi:TPA: YitT family protein [Streptococcus suis]
MLQKFSQYLLLMFGLVVMSLGIALFIRANLGANPLTTFTNGIALKLNVSIGLASQLLMLSLVGLVYLLDRTRIGIGTVVNGISTGLFIDVFLNLLPKVDSHSLSAWFLLACACILFSIGLGLYVAADLGEGAVDSFMVIIRDRCRIKLREARILLDVLLVLFGFLLGSRIGLGTLLGMVTTGPIMNRTIQLVKERKINHG